MGRWMLLAMVVLACGLVRADLIYFHDGTVREGKVVQQADDHVVVAFVTPTGTVRVRYPTAKIDRIETKKTPEEQIQEEYQQRATAIQPDDADGWAELGAWCSKHAMLQAEARGAYRQALTLDPDHEAARKALGFVNYRGVWMTEDESMGAQGYVKLDGRWVSRDEYDRRLEEEAARSSQFAAREQELLQKLAEAEVRAAEAERKLRDTEDQLKTLDRRLGRLEEQPKTIIIKEERERYPLWPYLVWWSQYHAQPKPQDPAPPTAPKKPEPTPPLRPGGPIGKKIAVDVTTE